MIPRLTKKAANYVYRFFKRNGVTAANFYDNLKKSIEVQCYLYRKQLIVKPKLIKQKTKVYLKFNALHKPQYPSKRKRKRQHAQLTWSKRVAVYLKQQRSAGKHNIQVINRDNVHPKETALLPDDIQKLKERLEQYKINNGSVKVDSNGPKEVPSNPSAETSRYPSPVVCDLDVAMPVNDDLNSPPSITEKPEKNGLIMSESLDGIDKPASKSSKFLDSLINKLKNNGNNAFVNERTGKPKKTTTTVEESDPKTDMSLVASNYDEDSSNSSDFLGFTETDNSFGLLPTPIVPKEFKCNKSAFISERLDTFLRENSLENRAQVELPKRRSFEEGMVCAGALPPKIQMPFVPKEIGKARTVAEKRMLFAKKRSVKYFMIENENTIYREIKKRSKYGSNNINIIEHMQNLEVPFTRDCWKASTWLHTINGRFYFQIINIDGSNYKIIGGKGNHLRKYMGTQSSQPIKQRKRLGCPPNCTQQLNFKNIKLRKTQIEVDSEIPEENYRDRQSPEPEKCVPEFSKTLQWPKTITPGYTPSPLSKKCSNSSPNKFDEGNLEVYHLPSVQLQVFPKINQPLDDLVKPYLKLILPSDKISKEWAEFAVSTLLIRNQSKASSSKSTSTEQKAFIFDIPYINNQKTLLVRKIYKRHEHYGKPTDSLSFRTKINPENDLEVDCGDILTDMIDSVALGLSEDTFIKSDPDIDYVRNDIKDKNNAKIDQEEVAKPEKENKSDNSSRRRLLMELKRLNATIVDTNNKFTPDVTKCKLDCCRLGCICQSINNGYFVKTHCKKVMCMFECTCKINISVNNGESNKALSNEDALLIREKATARLARMEKEFCATVVLTDNKTYLINESQSDKRRMKRVPRRFDNFVNDDVHATNLISDSEIVQPSPKPIPKPITKPLTLKNFKHCNVSLRKIEFLEGIQPWCMIHSLYKCFCKGKAIEGETFEIKKDEAIVEEEIVYARKRRYSFDKDEDNSVIQKAAKRKYFAAAYNSCSRVNQIPSNVYHTLNRQQLNTVRTKAKSDENESTRNLLTRRIIRSIQYKPVLSPIRRIQNAAPKMLSDPMVKRPTPDLGCSAIEEEEEENASPSNPVQESKVARTHVEENSKKVLAQADKAPEVVNITINLLDDQSIHLEAPKTAPIITRKLNLLRPSCEEPLNLEPVVDISTFEEGISESEASMSSTSATSLIKNNLENNLPVITSVRSLNTTIDTSAASALLTVDTSGKIPGLRITNGKISTEDFHANAIAKLNLAVTKTMQSICNIQKKNSKEIPFPAPKTLSSVQWRFFSQAFSEDLVFIWEVSVNGSKSIAATTTNIMPRVPGAMSVSNIKALTGDRLPLFGKMLLENVMNEKMNTLSVLMTGHDDYWHIIGFINSKQDYLTQRCVIKPTPESHPQVSEKVNALYKLLIIREMKILAAHASKVKINTQFSQESIVLTQSPTTPGIQQANLNGIPDNQLPPCNIELKTMTSYDLDSTITIPIPVKEDHCWLMLSIENDFSHIYIPSWKSFLSHDRIKKSFMIAMHTKKTVRLGVIADRANIYATPGSSFRIYFGPFKHEIKMDIILYQNVQGKMMLREDFEKSHNLKRIKQTVAYWIHLKNSQLVCGLRPENGGQIPIATNDQNHENIVKERRIESIVNSTERNIVQKKTPIASTSLRSPSKSPAQLSLLKKRIEMPRKNSMSSAPYHKPNQISNPLAKKTLVRRNTLIAQAITSSPTVNIAPVPDRQSLPLKTSSTSAQSNVLLRNQLESASRLPNPDVLKKLPKGLVITTEKVNSSLISMAKPIITQKPILLPNVGKDVTIRLEPQNIGDGQKCYGPKTTSTVTSTADKVNNTQSATENLNRTPLVQSVVQSQTAPLPQAAIQKFGYVISDSITLGKVPAERTPNGYKLRMPNASTPLIFSNMDLVGKYMSAVIKRVVKDNYSKYLPFNWRFVPYSTEEHKKYSLIHIPVLLRTGLKSNDDSSKNRRQTSSVTSSNPNNVVCVMPSFKLTSDLSSNRESSPINEINKIPRRVSTKPATTMKPVLPTTAKPISPPDVILIDD